MSKVYDFEKLGYKVKFYEEENIIWCQKKQDTIYHDIIFDLNKRKIINEILYYNKSGKLLKIEGTLELEELQIIIEVVRELNWNE